MCVAANDFNRIPVLSTELRRHFADSQFKFDRFYLNNFDLLGKMHMLWAHLSLVNCLHAHFQSYFLVFANLLCHLVRLGFESSSCVHCSHLTFSRRFFFVCDLLKRYARHTHLNAYFKCETETRHRLTDILLPQFLWNVLWKIRVTRKHLLFIYLFIVVLRITQKQLWHLQLNRSTSSSAHSAASLACK